MIFENLFTSTAGAQTATPASPASQQSPLGMFLPMVLVFLIFYMLMIRPQQKQRKQHQTMLQTVKKGDDVVTTAGIHGKIFGVADNIVTLEIADNVRIKIDKAQIAQVKTPPTAVAA